MHLLSGETSPIGEERAGTSLGDVSVVFVRELHEGARVRHERTRLRLPGLCLSNTYPRPLLAVQACYKTRSARVAMGKH